MRLPRVEDVERRLPKPDDFTSRARGPELTARVGLALGIAFGICFLTGFWSHLQYSFPGWVQPSPAWLYRFTQGLHVISGVAAIPLLLVKLWSVYPRLFILPGKPDPTTAWLAEQQETDTSTGARDDGPEDEARPSPRQLVVEVLEKMSIAALVAAGIFQLVTGTINIVGWYPWEFSFRSTHYAVAWIAIGSLLVHIAVKLPVIRAALGVPVHHREADPGHDEDAPSRRHVLLAAGAASGLAVLLTAGQSVSFLGKVSLFGVRAGDGPQDLPINRTASGAGATAAATSPDYALEIVMGGEEVSLTHAQLMALPQSTHRLPIACVEGWSRSADWTGVPVRELIAMVGAPPTSTVTLRSMQTRGAFRSSLLTPAYVEDDRTMLALRLNGQPLSLDHGFPARLIAPNRPGVFQTKWVRRLEVRA